MAKRRGILIASLVAVGCGGSTASTQAKWADRPNVQKIQEVPRAIDQATDRGAKPAPPPASRKPVTESVPIEGSELVRGRSTVIVEAPIDKVRKAILSYGKYAGFMPHYRVSKVIRKTATGHEVYMQVEALHGAVKMWARLDMTPRKEGDVEHIESKFLEGNVKDFRAAWRLEPSGGGRTKLTLDVFLHPKLPLPTGVLNDENVKGAEKGVVAMRKRIEKGG